MTEKKDKKVEMIDKFALENASISIVKADLMLIRLSQSILNYMTGTSPIPPEKLAKLKMFLSANKEYVFAFIVLLEKGLTKANIKEPQQ